jgi:hypothetical protein
VQSAVSLHDENPENCTELMPGMHQPGGIPIKDHQALKAVFNPEDFNRRVARQKFFLTEE